MDSQWTGVAITGGVTLASIGVNLFIVGKFVGQWGEALKNITASLRRVDERIEEVGEQGETTAGKVALIDQRLITTEQATSKFWEMRDAFTGMTKTIEIEGKHQREKLESLGRSISVMERQLGNLVSTRAGFTTITTEEKN